MDRHRLQFVPEHFVQTKAEKGGGRGRKALMESFATETRGQRGHHAPQRRMRQPQLAQGQEHEKVMRREPPVALLKPRLFSQSSNLVFFNPANNRGSPLMLMPP